MAGVDMKFFFFPDAPFSSVNVSHLFYKDKREKKEEGRNKYNQREEEY